jgi:hypothetical protein
MPGLANLSIYQGDDYAAVVSVSGNAGAPVDLTGYTAQAQIRLGPADANAIVVVEMIATIVPPNAVNLSIPHAITCQLSGCYVWDLQLKSSGGAISTVLAGSVVVTREVTREPGDNTKKPGDTMTTVHPDLMPKGLNAKWQLPSPAFRR